MTAVTVPGVLRGYRLSGADGRLAPAALRNSAFLVVAAFLLTNKVWSPQFSLLVGAAGRAGAAAPANLLAWMTIDALVWVPRMLYLYGEQNRGLPEQWFTTTVLLRDIAVVVLIVLVVRQIRRPELDLVRERGVDDPSGGVFDRAPDNPPRWLPTWLRPPAVPVPAESADSYATSCSQRGAACVANSVRNRVREPTLRCTAKVRTAGQPTGADG